MASSESLSVPFPDTKPFGRRPPTASTIYASAIGLFDGIEVTVPLARPGDMLAHARRFLHKLVKGFMRLRLLLLHTCSKSQGCTIRYSCDSGSGGLSRDYGGCQNRGRDDSLRWVIDDQGVGSTEEVVDGASCLEHRAEICRVFIDNGM